MKIEVGKKYLDEYGDRWTVIGTCQFFSHLFKAVKDTVLAMGPERFHASGDSYSLGVPNLVSEVPSPATTTPQEPTKFKVGDRVRVRDDCSTNPLAAGMTLTVVDVPTGGSWQFRLTSHDGQYGWFYAHELEHLTTDTPTTPSLVQCSCPTVVLMRDGCKCGCARKEIEQEFKQRGWK